MNRTAALLTAALLAVAGATAPVGGLTTGAEGHAPQSETATPDGNGSAEPAAPGAHLAGVVDVQESEVESEVEGRAFGIRIARANSNGSRAAVVAEQVDELRARTDALRDRKQSLIEARQNGSISQSRFQAEMAALVARTDAVQSQLNRTESASNDIPADLLESKGVNATAIATLRNDSRDLAGPEVAAVARSIAGPRGGGGLGVGRATGPGAGNGGPPGDGNATSTDRPTPRGPPGGPPGQNETSSPDTPDSTRSQPTGPGGPGTNAPATNPGQGGGNDDGGSDGPSQPPG